MKKPIVLLLFSFITFISQAQYDNGTLDHERIFSSGQFFSERFGPARWIDNGDGYTTLEASPDYRGARDVIRYETKTGERAVLIPASQLIPSGQQRPLSISNYTWSPNKKKLLIFTNTKRVWRLNTRGDYWVLDLESGSLKQMGADMKASTLMFAKFSPDNNRVGFVQKNNIYVQDIASGKVTQLTSDGTVKTINGTFDWLNGGVTVGAANPVLINIASSGVFNIDVAGVNFDNRIIIDGTVNINNGGLLNLIATNNYAGSFNIASGGTLVSDSGDHFLQDGVNGSGTLQVNMGGNLSLGAASTAGDLQMSGGRIGGSSLILSGLSTVSSAGADAAEFRFGSTDFIYFQGGADFTGDIDSGNEIKVSTGSTSGTTTMVDDGSGLFSFIVDGSGNVQDGAFVVNGNTTIEPGITVDGGTLDITATALLDVSATGSIGVINQNGGTIAGNGTIVGDVSNDANLNPGSSPGLLTIDGDLALGANSALNLDLNGTTSPGVDYDVLDVTGSIAFGGDLNIVTSSDQTSVAVADSFAPVTSVWKESPTPAIRLLSFVSNKLKHAS